MQTAINPALAAAMTLEQAAQMGEFSPVTKDGTPTVVGGMLRQAMPPQMGMPQGMPGMQPSMPGVQNVAQQAGLGGQIQAMQMQEAQKAMMQQAMQQARPPAGIERLNPQMGNFAEGGIIGRIPGYAEAGVAEDEQKRLAQIRSEYEQEVGKFTDDVPYVPGGTTKKVPTESAESSGIETLLPEAEAIYAPATEELEKLRTTPPTGQEVTQYLQEMDPAQRAYYISKGIDPDALMKREAENKRLFDAQRALLQERMARQEGGDTMMSRLGAALRGFRQMKGQGIGGGILSSYENLARQVESGQLRMDQLKETELKINELEVNSRRSLEDARRSIAEGNWNKAQSELAASQKMANDATKLRADLKSKIGAAAVQMRGQDVRAETSRYGADIRAETARRAQDIRQALGLASASGKAPRVHKTKTDEDGYEVIIMSDGTQVNTGVRSQEFNNRISNIVIKLRKENPEFRDLPVEEQRNVAAEVLTGKKGAAKPTAAPAPSAPAPSASAPRGTRDNPIKLD